MIRIAFATVVALVGFVAFALWSVHERPPGGAAPAAEVARAAVAQAAEAAVMAAESAAASVEKAAAARPTPVAREPVRSDAAAPSASSPSRPVPAPRVPDSPAAVADGEADDATISDDRSAPFVEASLETGSEIAVDADGVATEPGQVAESVGPETRGTAPAGRDAELAAELIRRMLAVYLRTQTPR